MADSFEIINYGLRPNKAVERKLIFDAFSRLNTHFGFEDYRYIGFGAVLFVDFVLAHQALKVSEMISIEKEVNAPRAEKNRPFGCIKVFPGDSKAVFNGGRLNLSEKRTIAWLDYDGPVDEDVIADIDVLCTNLPEDSFLIVTANAVRSNYLVDDPDTNEKRSLEVSIAKKFGSLVPDDIPMNFDSVKKFPPVLLSILKWRFRKIVEKSRKDLSFIPIFNYIYSDGSSPMVTLGGVICKSQRANEIKATAVLKEDIYHGEAPFSIELPVLTPKERIILGSLLPSSSTLDNKAVAKALGFPMKPSIVEAYRRLYRFYPQYSEIAAFS